ncbi:MAG: TadE family protein, partial [Chloroflexota bacterium]|nr:TadE family protein [Chloroflexota bacterium]
MEAKCTQPKNSKGQSIVEMAVMLPILLVITVGLVEIGAILFTQMSVTNAAREGTRFGVAGGMDTSITTVVTTTLSSILSYDETNTNVYVIRGRTGPSGQFDTSTDDLHADSYWYVR